MLFAIYCIDKPNSLELRMEVRPAHVAYLEERENILRYAGPLLGEDEKPLGSLLIVDVENLEAARVFADEDPYSQARLFASVAINGTRQVFPR